MTDDDRILLNHLRDLQKRAERSGISTFSGFLSLPEQDLFLRNVREYGFHDYRLEGGTKSAERRIVAFSGDGEGFSLKLPIVVLEVTPLNEKYAEELSHRDVLGAMMSLGIDRSLTGDILIRDKTAFVICLTKIADFLMENLTKIRHTDVRCTYLNDPDLFKLQPKFEEIRVIQIRAAHVGVTDLREILHEEIRNLCKTDHTGSLIPDEDVAGQAAVDPEAHHGAEDVAMREFLGEFFC